MKHDIVLAPEAAQELRALKASIRQEVKDALEVHLRHEPTKVSKSRIKKLRGVSKPQFRLRIGEIRVFYDVVEDRVEVLGIIPKSRMEAWLDEKGKTDEESGAIGS